MKQKRQNVYKSGHKDYNQLDTMRHSAAHLMAAAVMTIWPKTKFGIGPTTANGFYYDFALPVKISEVDLVKIEQKMYELQKLGYEYERSVLGTEEATKRMTASGQTLKAELLDDLRRRGVSEVSLYRSGEFIDLCSGPHVKNVSEIGPFKLLSVAGAYWKGDEKNVMLTRIYGTCFATKAELDKFFKQQQEAKKHDHRKIGKEQELFIISPAVGPGFPLYLPKGFIIRRILDQWVMRQKEKRGYQFVWTPHVAKSDLYKTSGHWQKYEAMFNPMKLDDEQYVVKPMNCPHHFQIYLSRPRSYRELPLRLAENATVYRNEKAGELSGLLRVRALTQDDTHTFVRESQIPQEIDRILELTVFIFKAFGFRQYRARISISDSGHFEKYLGDQKTWVKAEKALVGAVKRQRMEYFIGVGEAAFYGPKIDVLVSDALGREWQLTTVQLDFNQPVNFDLTYTNEEGKSQRPAVLHIAILGSLERFIAILLEHYAGALPLWLAPVQVVLIPIAQRHNEIAARMAAQLKDANIRVETDMRNEPMQAKIRDHTLQKVPYLGIIGDKEAASGELSVRTRSGEDLKAMKLEQFLNRLDKELEHDV